MCRRKLTIYCCAFACLLFMNGCLLVSKDAADIKRQIRSINRKLSVLNAGDTSSEISIGDIYKEIEKANKRLKPLEQINVIKRNQAAVQAVMDEQAGASQELKAGLEDLTRLLSNTEKNLVSIDKKLDQASAGKTEIDKLQKNFELLFAKISQIQEISEISMEREAKRSEYKFNEINAKIAGVENKISAFLDVLRGKAPKGSKPGKKTTRHAVKTKPPSTPKRAKDELNVIENYQTAYNHYLNGNYNSAIDMFKTYLNTNPDTSLSDNARYWLGESYYSKKEYESALKEFSIVIDIFSKSSKVSSALLKSAYALDVLNRPDDALAKLDTLVQKYPKSDEAELGRKKIAALKEEGSSEN